jgi:hypothetical protein
VESLAQEFDGHETDWESLDETKRTAIDRALEGADDDVANRVRAALLSVEHVALGRRFREFSIAHLTPEFFRQGASGVEHPVGRADLPEVLALAYKSRSKYVHELKQLPQEMTFGHGFHETTVHGRETHLTLQGLARVMRAVIVEFVRRQPTVAHEPYEYLHERSGVAQVRMAPQYWVGRADGDITRVGRDKLEGFLEQLASCLLREEGASVTDMRDVLVAATDFVPRLEARLRRPYLALHLLFNMYAGRERGAPTPANLEQLINRELNEPCAEALLCHTVYGMVVDWPIPTHLEAIQAYLRRRGAKNGLRLPKVFEGAITLDVAERYRAAGDVESARGIVSLAVENNPGHARLLELEQNFDGTVAIEWRTVLLPPAPVTPAATGSNAADPSAGVAVPDAPANADGGLTGGALAGPPPSAPARVQVEPVSDEAAEDTTPNPRLGEFGAQ